MPLATEDLIRLRLRHLGVVDAVTGERIKPARKGDVFGSEARPASPPFLDLYAAGSVAGGRY